MMIQLPTERTQATQEEKVDWHVASQLWPYAGQELHEMRYRIFQDLWERGYYLTAGSKFGGDFLVYPGEGRFLRDFTRLFAFVERVLKSIHSSSEE